MASVVSYAAITSFSLSDVGLAGSPLHANGVPDSLTIWAAGQTNILEGAKTAFFCSTQCPGGVILKTFDAITAMRDEGRTVIGGFHSPMEWECLRILLRGKQPVIWVPARSIVGMRLKPELRPAFEAGRLLILSPFEPKHKRITATLAEQRNRFVAAIATELFIPHAAPNSRTLALSKEQFERGKPIISVSDPANDSIASFSSQQWRSGGFVVVKSIRESTKE